MMQLRQYQEQARVEVARAFAEHQRTILLVADTGAGKTTLGVAIAMDEPEESRILWCAHRRELVSQPFCTMVRAGIAEQDIGVQLGSLQKRHTEAFRPSLDDAAVWGLAHDRTEPRITVASIDCLRARGQLRASTSRDRYDLIIIDEAHRAENASYQKLLARNPRARVVKLTATPQRSDGLPIRHDRLIEVACYADLARDGFLVTPMVWTTARLPDLKGVQTRAGDYVARQLGERCNRRVLVGDAVEHWRRRANGLRSLAFCCTIEHSVATAAAFNAAGIAAAHVDGTTARAERERIFADLRAGRLLVVTNVDVATEGTDIPSVKCILMMRPTNSLRIHRQQAGRGARPFEHQPFILLDHAGNCLRHGLPQQPQRWDVEQSGAPHVQSTVICCRRCGLTRERTSKRCPTCQMDRYFDVTKSFPVPDVMLEDLVNVDVVSIVERARRAVSPRPHVAPTFRRWFESLFS